MVDFKKIYVIFIDEAMERLADLEGGLLQLEKFPQDKELINTIFRAAHTIKGSSGGIGLKDISRFTHHMEEILELLRQGRIAPGKELITTLLDAVDRIKEMVESVSSGAAFDFSKCGDLIERMEAMKGGSGKSVCTGAAQMGSKAGSARNAGSRPGGGGRESLFRIIFSPAPDLFRRGIDPSMFLDDLKGMGEIAGIRVNTDTVPIISELDVETLYMKWDILFRTDKDEDEIRKTFEFVEDGSDIKIFPVTDSGSSTPLIGQILMEEGKVKPEDIEEALKSQKRLGEILVEQGKATERDVERAVEKQIARKSELFKSSVTSTIRVDLGKLDHLINTVGEMVIINSMLQQALKDSNELKDKKESGNPSLDVGVVFSQLQRIGKEIQESAMSLRMMPVGEVFQRFTRLVRELSASENKKIELVITGEETELDKGVLEKIADPLVHLIRNSIDHGIEAPGERVAKGKPEKGTIYLSACQSGDSVNIEVEDDGRGLSKERILEKAVSNGVVKGADGLTDDQAYSLIFLPGFSTAERVTDVSGRGVGMDVVKRNIESLNGRVAVRTKTGTGTKITITLPLTLAIIDGLAALVGEEVFIIPLSSVLESLRPDRDEVKTLVEKGEVVNVRGEYIRMIRLHEILDIAPRNRDPWDAIAVVAVYDGRKYCFLVDGLIGQQQIVIKHLGTAVPKVCDIAGGTILGDGRVALVLDIPGIVEMATRDRYSVAGGEL